MSSPPAPVWDAFASDLEHTAVLTDFDGTLSAMVPDPDTAVPLPGAVAVLERLAQRAHTVAVISGRPLEFLTRHFGGGLTLAGLYGLEIRENGLVTRPPEVETWRAVIGDTVTAARAELPEDVRVEHKGLALTLHYREAPHRQAEVERWARARANSTGLRTADARCSVELNPPLSVDKGTVVTSLADNPGVRHACYLGDDRADAAAFVALRRLRTRGVSTHTVAVRGAETPTEVLAAADQVVEGPPGALELLRRLAQGASRAI